MAEFLFENISNTSRNEPEVSKQKYLNQYLAEEKERIRILRHASMSMDIEEF